MTSPAATGSGSSPEPARTFEVAAELKKALRVRNVTQARLAEACGVVKRTIWHWTTGQSLPTLDNAARMAEALDWPRLAEIVRAARTVRCRVCSRRIVSEQSSQVRRYCDEACRRLWLKREIRTPLRTRTDMKIALLTDAVDRMCWSCEPLGVCGDGTCPLRVVSPLPLRHGVLEVPQAVDGRRSRWDDPAARERAGGVQRRIWHQSEERRARLSRLNRERWARMSPGERASIGAKVSESLRRRVA